MTEETKEAKPEDNVLNINGKQYLMSDLTPEILQFVQVYKDWTAKHEAKKLEAFMIEAALKSIGLEIQSRLDAMQAANDVPETPAPAPTKKAALKVKK